MIQPFKQKKCVYHVRLELGNHRKKKIYIYNTHPHTRANMHALFWQATHANSSQRLIEY